MSDFEVDKIVFMGDPHFHEWQQFSHTLPSGINSRLQLSVDAMIQAAELAGSEGMLVVMGDMFHDRSALTHDVISSAIKAVDAASCLTTLVMLNGNHDQSMRDGSQHSLEMFRYFPNVTTVDIDMVISAEVRDKQLKLCCRSFTEDMEEVRKFAERSAKIKGPKIMCLHQGVRDAVMDGGKIDQKSLTIKQLQHEAFDAIICGHYHTPQQIQNLYFVGSPYQSNRGEAGQEKRFLVYDGEMRSEPVTDMPEFRTIRYSSFKNVEECKEFMATTQHFTDLVVEADRSNEVKKADLPNNVTIIAENEEPIMDVPASEITSLDLAEAARQYMTVIGRPDLADKSADRLPL